MAKLWQKEYTLDSLMEEFSVGSDYLVDLELVIADCLGSIAHARGLAAIGILSDEELQSAEEGLIEIIGLRQRGEFVIRVEDEDCHTAIEEYLTKTKGAVGKKIHTGRSRNDQVQTALRVWMREFTYRLAQRSTALAHQLFIFAQNHSETPMPGRTHMQIAMPSSVGLWAAAYGEQLLDCVTHLVNLAQLLDQSPLGSAASYGSALGLDRRLTADALGFSAVQNNVLYANNSRGFFEAMLLDGCDYIGLTLSKLAQDLMLFTLPEFGYFSLPPQLLTGSSIMPQKKNPDGLELARSRSSLIGSAALRIKSTIRSLPSGYNRDFQDTKEPLFSATKAAWQLVGIFELMVSSISVHEEALISACTPELYATDVVLQRVAKGESFRDVYRQVGEDLASVEALDPIEALKARTALGNTANLGLEEQLAKSEALLGRCQLSMEDIARHYRMLSGLEGVGAVLY